jgi:hypothetical protein
VEQKVCGECFGTVHPKVRQRFKQRSYWELGQMKKIYDVSTIYKGKTFKEVVHADSADEAFEIISKKYNRERIISVRERSNH